MARGREAAGDPAFWPISAGFALMAAFFLIQWLTQRDVTSLQLALTATGVAGICGTWAPPGRFSRLAFVAALGGASASLLLSAFLLWSGQADTDGIWGTWWDVATAVAILAVLAWSAIRSRRKSEREGVHD